MGPWYPHGGEVIMGPQDPQGVKVLPLDADKDKNTQMIGYIFRIISGNSQINTVNLIKHFL